MMKSQFEKGREYERRQKLIFEHKTMGWLTLIMAPIFFFWDFNTRVNFWAGLTLFGCCNLLLAYSEMNGLKKWKKNK